MCGTTPNTRDHVPPKVLLDEPYPDFLMVVECCSECNSGASADEEYFACLIECVLSGTADPKALSRTKIQKILSKKESLRKRIQDAKREVGDQIYWLTEENRVRSVILKLARAHAKYELSEAKIEEPEYIWIKPLPILSDEESDDFFRSQSISDFSLWPEIGSRAMQRLALSLGGQTSYPWVTVQPGNYEYAVTQDTWNPLVRIVVRNYLAAQVAWI